MQYKRANGIASAPSGMPNIKIRMHSGMRIQFVKRLSVRSKKIEERKIGTKTMHMNGKHMIKRKILPHFLLRSLSRSYLEVRSSNWPTPHPVNEYSFQWSESAVAPRWQIQQNSYKQNPQVIWLQPLIRSILVLHIGQKETFFFRLYRLI